METLWWRCVWDHVFRAAPVPEGGEMQCPMPDDDKVCGTYLIYAPYPTEAEAQAGEVPSGQDKWAPWARSNDSR